MAVRRALGPALQTLVGLALVQMALPKLLPLPGISDLWWLFVLGGGSWGRLATLVGGALVAVWGVSLIPEGLGARGLALSSAGAAVGSRLLLLALGLGLGVPVRWEPGPGAVPGALLGLGLVALVYGGVAYALAALGARGRG